MTDVKPSWTPIKDADLPEFYRHMVTTTIPFLRKVAIKQFDAAAYVLLEAQEQAVRFGEFKLGSLLAMLASSSLFEPATLDKCYDALEHVAGEECEAIKPAVDAKLKALGLENVSMAEMIEKLRRQGVDV